MKSIQRSPNSDSLFGEFEKLTNTIVFMLFLSLFFILYDYGWPLDDWTSLVFSFLCALTILLWIVRRRKWAPVVFFVVTVLLFSIILPCDGFALQDVRRGRCGIRINPWNLRFGRDGVNTGVIEEYLGRAPDEWRSQACLPAFRLFYPQDGNERVNSRSLIRTDQLKSILSKLPNQNAHKQVLSCLTDPDNLMRVHQGLFLSCLETFGFPGKMTSESWWAQHQWIFYHEKDGRRAASLTFDWQDRCRAYLPEKWYETERSKYRLLASQLWAVYYQDRGGWGGDRAFATARWDRYDLTQEQLNSEDRAHRIAVGAKEIAWW